MALLIVGEGRLQARPDRPLPHHVHRDHRHVLVALVEVRRPPPAEDVAVVEHDVDDAVLAVDEPDVAIRVGGPDGDEDLGVEDGVGLHVEGPHLELLHLVRRDLGYVHGVEVRGDEA